MVRAAACFPGPSRDDGPGWRWIFNTPYGPIERLTQMLGLGPLNLCPPMWTGW